MTRDEARAAFDAVFDGSATDAAVADLLTTLHQRGETVDEILGALDAAWAARATLAWQAPEHAIDTCGTGGDGRQTFNVSTTVGLAAAAMGIPVIKHGNRAMSSKSGSADVLQALAIPLEPEPEEALQLLQDKRFVFLFAPRYHPAFKRVAPIRKALGHRTIFNLLGPLLNPAAVKRQVVGVFAPQWVEPLAHVLARRGHARALVVHGGLPDQGTDEVASWGETLIAEVDGAMVKTRRFTPPPMRGDLGHVSGGEARDNAAVTRAVLAGTAPLAQLELTALNLAAAIWAAGRGAPDFESNYPEALAFLESGQAGQHWSRGSRSE